MFKQFLNQPVSEGGARNVGVEEDDITNDINSLVKKVFSDTAKTSVRLKILLEALEKGNKNKVTEETKADVDKAVPVGNPETTVAETVMESEKEEDDEEDTVAEGAVATDGATETVAETVMESEKESEKEEDDEEDTVAEGAVATDGATEEGVDPAVKQGGRKPRKTKRKRNRNRNRSSKKSKNQTVKRHKKQ